MSDDKRIVFVNGIVAEDIEEYSLSLSRDTVKQCSEHIQRMLGDSIHPPFMGFVDGKHPKRLLED